jgi:hypothetical protein
MKLKATYKGLMTGILMILLSITLFYVMQVQPSGPQQIWVIVLYIAGIIWSLLDFHHSQNHSLVKFKDYFSEGFKTFIIVTLLMVLYTGIFYKLNPAIVEAVISSNEAMVLQMGDKTPAEISENSAKLRSIFMPMTISLTTVTYLFFGAITTLIGSLFLNNARGSANKTSPHENASLMSLDETTNTSNQ